VSLAATVVAIGSADALGATAPTLARTVVVAPVKGSVFVRLPRSAMYVRLRARRVISVGSTVDTTHGAVDLSSAGAVAGKIQKGTFDGGAFVVTQDRTAMTNLTLAGGRRSVSCVAGRGDPLASPARLSRGVLRSLHGHAHGNFRTSGGSAAATIRGTEWTTTDTCSGTVIADQHGKVETAATGANFSLGTLTRGESTEYRCSQTGLPPVSSAYCVGILAVDTTETVAGRTVRYLSYITGLTTKSPDESNQLCITGPRRMPACTEYPLAPNNHAGYRESIVGCTPQEGPGDYVVSWRLGGVQLGMPIVYHAPAAEVLSGPCNAWLGQPTIGWLAGELPVNVKRVNRYSLPTAATVSSMYAYLGQAGATGQELVRGVVYADAAGAPGKLLGTTNEISVTQTSHPTWYFMPFAQRLALPSGDYWIGLITGGQPGVAAIAYNFVQGSRAYNSNDYTAGPSDPFGPISVDDAQMSVYLFYAVAN
jgi:hypothetical protein